MSSNSSARLLREHGGLGGLLTADAALLCAERGMGEAKTSQLRRRWSWEAAERADSGRTLADHQPNGCGQPDDAGRAISLRAAASLVPRPKNYVVAQQVVYQGTVISSVVRVAEVFKPAISRTCPAIVVVHNHPSGDPAPSPEECDYRAVAQSGELLDIELLDHIVVGHNCFVSMKERRLGSEYSF